MFRLGLHALKWSLLGELGARVVGPLSFILLARLLVPADFGIVAAATVLLSFAQVVCELGLPKALVQRQDDFEGAADTAFWLSLAFGAVLTLLLFVLAQPLARFFDEPRVAEVLLVLAPTMPVASAAAVPLALMQRQLAFRALFWVRLFSATVPAALSVALALAGGGVWALVAGSVVMPVVQLALAFWLGPWRPRWRFDRQVAGELLRFGRWALLSALLGWGYTWLDTLMVGRTFGAHEMGLYRTGNTLVTLVFGSLFAPLAPVLYSLFARVQTDVQLLRESLMTVVRAVALLSLPLAVLLFLGRDLLALHVLGERWREAGPVIGWLALTQGATWLVAYNGELLRAVGVPRAEAWVMGAGLGIYALVYWITVRHGMDALLQARFALGVFSIALHVLTLWYFVGLSPRAWSRPLLAAALCLAALALSPWLAAACLVGVWVLEWPLLRQLHARWRSGRAPARPSGLD